MTDDYPSQTLDTQEIKRRSFFGVVALTSRTFILQIIALVATFILTVLLDPAEYGIFFVVTAAVNFLNYFSDIGLAAALIQKKEEPTRDDLLTTFTIQQLLVGCAVLIALVSAGAIARFYQFTGGGLFLFQAFAIAFLLSSLKTIPSILLERKLQFQKLVIPQILETLSFYIVAIVLALMGRGVTSFAWAALARGLVGTVALYALAPWRPGFKLDIASARKLLAFGLPFQTNSFLALVKDDLLIVFLGKILPLAQIGYIGWAKKWAEIALRLIMDNIIRVSFPTYSRLQHDSHLLATAIQKSLLFLALLAFPIAIGMMFMIEPFISVVPRYSKWEPALISFYLFTISSILATISSPLVNALNATGKVKYTFYLMIMWTVLTWCLVPLLVSIYGFNGVALAAVIIGSTSFIPLYFVRKLVKISFISQIIKPAFATIGMSFALAMIRLVVPAARWQLLLGVPTGILVYGGLAYFLMGPELVPYIQLLLKRKG